MTERRQTSRRRVCLGGRIRPAAFLPDHDCILRDVSLDGACIRVAADAALPGRFDLSVPCRGETRRARLIWRAADLAGVRFEEPPPEARGAVPHRAADPAPEAAWPAHPMRAGGDGPDRLH